MTTAPPKTPPRFVPTLTDVVQVPGTAQFAGTKAVPPQEAAAAPVAADADAAPEALRLTPDDSAHAHSDLPEGLEEHVVHRVMQRVDLVLDQRLREAIAQVIGEQTRSMIPRLREEVESVVRHAVYEAVADELAGKAS